jgi:hypothetical protein
MEANFNPAVGVSDCFGRQACYCFEKLPVKELFFNFDNHADHVKFNITHVQAHLDLLYKHQLTDQLARSSDFELVQARYVKKALDSHIETLQLFERIIKDS